MRLAIAWSPVDWLLRTTLGDDSFYYFTIARQLSRGYGFTFDTIEPTNGFHPLWMFVIAPLFAAVRDRDRAIHAVLTVSAICDVAALALLGRLLRRLGVANAVSAVVALLYAFSPNLLSLSGPLNGLETALNLAVTFGFLLLYMRVLGRPQPTVAGALQLGAGAGLLFLARTDNAIILVFAYASMFWFGRKHTGRARHLALSAVGAFVVAAPWLAWSSIKFGSPVQVSGQSVAYVVRDLTAAHGWTVVDYARKFLHNVATTATYFPVYHVNTHSFAAAAAGNIIMGLGLAAALARAGGEHAAAGRQAFIARVRPWIPLLGAYGVFVLLHTLRAIELRGWYYTSLLPVLYVVLALALDDVASRVKVARPGTALTLVVIPFCALAVVFIPALRSALEPRCGETDSRAMIRAVNRAVPDGTLVGSWNAGLYGYYFERGHVVDLDGLVNNGVYASIRNRSQGDYVAHRGIRYLLDAGGAMDLWKPYWNRGQAVDFPPPALDDTDHAECRSLRLVRLP